jgi:hypothetical protein
MGIDPLGSGGVGQIQKSNKNKRLQLNTRNREDVSFTDPKTGKTFKMSFNRTMESNYFTYDRRAFVPGAAGKGASAGQAQLFETSPLFHRAVTNYKETLAKLSRAHKGVDVEGAETAEVEKSGSDLGYWSVENTATRMFDFATALFADKGDGDRQKHFELMVAGMDKGYSEAAEEMGGLPDISRQTVDRAKEMLTEWADEGNSEPQPTTNLTA